MTGPSDSSVQVEALKGLLDAIHAGRLVPLNPASEGLCSSLVCAGEGALAAWDRRAALPVAALSDADRDLMKQEIDALEELTETIEMGDPHWADAKCFKAAVAAIAALRTRLLRHSEGKE